MIKEDRILITGGAGFIGSNLVDVLLELGKEVVVLDNMSTGQARFLDLAKNHTKFKLVHGDLLNERDVGQAIEGCGIVFHFAANADVRFGLQHPRKDLEQNTIATFNVLEAMRANGIKRIAFSSTGSVYGECDVIPTPENAPFPIQTSLYGASKVACETLIHGYCEGFELEGYIFRFVSILGERYTHGHVFDFVKQLNENPDRLRVLGDGCQRKSYLHVQDCVRGILHAIGLNTASKAKHRVETYNLGCDEFVQVNDSIRIICNEMKVRPELEYSGGNRGWVGDNPFIYLDTTKIRNLGWRPEATIEEGIVRTVKWLQANPWVYNSRV